MKLIIAYVLVVVVVQFCLTFGTLIVGFPIALALAWAPAGLRTFVAGLVSGAAGVAAAVAFGYFAFVFIAGPRAYGLFPFVASTVPLLIPILNDRTKARQLLALGRDMSPEVRAVTAPTTDAARYTVVGYIVGLIAACVWFFIVYDNAA